MSTAPWKTNDLNQKLLYSISMSQKQIRFFPNVFTGYGKKSKHVFSIHVIYQYKDECLHMIHANQLWKSCHLPVFSKMATFLSGFSCLFLWNDIDLPLTFVFYDSNQNRWPIWCIPGMKRRGWENQRLPRIKLRHLIWYIWFSSFDLFLRFSE